MEINDVSFGNPSSKQRNLIGKKSYLNDLFPDLIQEPVPLNDSVITKKELNEIVDWLNDINDSENEKHLKRYLFIDQNLRQFIFNNLQTKEFDVEQLIKNVIDDIEPLIIKLKFKYQRPRPKTLSLYLGLNLFPLNTFKADSPSFPSRTVVLGYLICNIIGSRVPELYDQSQEIIECINQSRSYLGANYQSDIEFSLSIGSIILKYPEFTEKYEV